MRIKLALAVIGLCAAAVTAACSGNAATTGSTGNAATAGGGTQASGTTQVMNVMRQISACIRSHGMPGFPDPIINPLTSQPDYPANAPRVPASIQQACQSIAGRLPPQAQSSQPPTAASMQALLRFARCMRTQGFANWPDPNALGEFPVTQQMAMQLKSNTSYRAAMNGCIKYVPGGSSYLQFVGTGAHGSGSRGNG